MGRKSVWRGEHLFLCLAGILFLWGNGCGPGEKRIERVELAVSIPPEEGKIRPGSTGKEERSKVEVGPGEDGKTRASGLSLARARSLLAQSDYEAALKECEKVLSLSGGKPPADEALFSMALIYAHQGNPRKDYQKAIALFRKLTREHPESPWTQEAKVWSGVLQENEKLNEMMEKTKRVDLDVEEKKKKRTK